MGVTRELARFAAATRFRDLDGEVVSKVKQLMLDCLGNQIGACGERPAEILFEVLEVARIGGKSTVAGYGHRTTPLLAGCMNGMLAHLLDMDDAHRDALTKTGSAITPAAMAVAEMQESSGEQVVEAVAVGYEGMIRLGLAVNPGHRRQGFHSTATLGVFGAALTAGHLLGLDESGMVDALGIAATQSAGLAAFINNESMTKPFNVARGVHNGILAALLAKKGFRGPPDVLEREEGFVQGYTRDADLGRITSGLGRNFHLLESGFKPHAACRYAHGPIDVAVALRREHAFALEEIESIEVWLSDLANRQSNYYDPRSVASAQGSTPFSIAAALTAGTDSLAVDDVKRMFDDERTRALHRRVVLHVDRTMDYMGRGCRVRIRLKAGEAVEDAVDLPRGEPESPMSGEEIGNKFRRQAYRVVGEQAGESLMEKMLRLERLPSVQELMALTKKSAAA